MGDATDRAKRARDVLATLSGSEEAGDALAEVFDGFGALGDYARLTGAGEIWSRPGLSRRDRSLVVVSMLAALGRDVELAHHVRGALHHGLARDEIDEVALQLAVYVGAPAAIAAAQVIAHVFADLDGSEGRDAPPPAGERKDDATRRRDGSDVLRTIVGLPEGSDPQPLVGATLEQLGPLGPLVVDAAFGDVWSRPQLSRRDRSLVVVSALTACSLAHELEIHLGAALNHGVTRDEIAEVMVTAVLYGGFPRGIDGWRTAQQVFAARDGAES